MDMEDDRISYDSDEERQRKREEEKESRRIAKLRAAMLVVAADDWLREDKVGQLDEEVIGMMERPDEIDPRDWEDAKVILADYKKYDFSDYWTSRLMPKEDGQETDLPKPDISYLGKSTTVTCREVLPFLAQTLQGSSQIPEDAADDNTEVMKLTTTEDLGNAFIRDYSGSSAGNNCQLTDENKPLKSCFKRPNVSRSGRPTRNVSFGITLVEVYYITNEERDFKKLDCDNDFVECNGRKLRDMSSSEIRMEELDNLDLFLARKLKYKQVQDFPVEAEVREEPKKEEKKKAPARKPVTITCDMVKKEMAKYKSKRIADDTPTPRVHEPVTSSSDVNADDQKPLSSRPHNVFSDIVVPHTRTLGSDKLPSDEAFRKQGKCEPPVDRMKRKLRRANNITDLANQTSVKSKDNGIPVVRKAFGAQDGESKKKWRKPKPPKPASDTTVMEVQNVTESDQTHSVSEVKLKTADPKRPEAEDRKWQKSTSRAPRVTPRSGDTDTVPTPTRQEERAMAKPSKQLHRSAETTETKGPRENRTDEQNAVKDEFHHLRTSGHRVIHVRSAGNGSAEWDNTLEDVHEPLRNECNEKNGEEGGLERDIFLEEAKAERNENVRSGLKKDKTGRKKKSKNCKKAAKCRIIAVKPVEDESHQWDNTITPETSPTPANRDTTSIPTSAMPTSSDLNPMQDLTLEEVNRGCPAPEAINPSTATVDSRRSDLHRAQSISVQTGSGLRMPTKDNLSSRLRNVSRRFRQGLSNMGQRLRRLSCLPNKST